MESRTEVGSFTIGGAMEAPAFVGRSRGITLRVGAIMSRDVVTAAPDDTLVSVAQTMSQRNVSCIVITREGRVVGIFTEKDMLNAVAGQRTGLTRLSVSEHMSRPVDTVAPETSLLEADRIMETQCIRRLPVLADAQLVGIVTQTDITRALISLNSLGCVAEIMTKPVVTVPVDATILEAARLICCSGISCLLVMQGQTAAGLLTKKDLLKRVIAPQKDLARTRVVEIMSSPVATIPAGCSILEASKKMETMHFHHLFVSDSQGVCGVVSQTDIMRAVRSFCEASESRQRTMQEELTRVLQRTIRDLQRVHDLFAGIPHPPSRTGGSVHGAPPAPEEVVVACAPSPSERT